MKRRRYLRDRELRVDAGRLEIASGYDGLFAGAPEAVVLIGAYALTDGRATTVFRSVHRADCRTSRFPQIALTAEVFGPAHGTVPVGATPLLLVCGLEDDGGGGVGAVLGALERADALGVTVDDPLHMVPLPELAPLAASLGSMRRTDAFIDGAPLSSLAPHDDWIGAAATVVRRPVDEQRAHLVTTDRRNDWTAVVSWRLQGG